MNTPEFSTSMHSLIKDATGILESAEKEYASDADRLANFKKRTVGSPESICFIYLTKHIDGIENYVNGRARVQRDSIRGRIIDSINYLILLNAIIEEEAALAITEDTRQPQRSADSQNIAIPMKLCNSCGRQMMYGSLGGICSNQYCANAPITHKA